MDEGQTAACPEPEVLAAWLDQGLGPAECALVEEHVATCDDCRGLVALVDETRHAVLEPHVAAAAIEPVAATPVSSPRRNIVWGATTVLAAAAVLVLVVQVLPPSWAPWRSGGADTRLADLAAAIGEERTVEARLTGGFRYGPLRAPARSGGSSAALDNWALFAVAGKIREDAERDPSAENLHALGLAHLLIAEYDKAIRAFEDAVGLDRDNARYQSDLAGAYLSRAGQENRPDDLPRALSAAERAVAADGELLEARFNRALALESLFLEDQARAAWEDYLTRDPGSSWANEARDHLQKLQKSEAKPDLARNNSPPPITDTSVEAGLDWLLRHGLPAWADAILANDSTRAARELSYITTYAQQLSAASGDALPAAIVTLTDVDPGAQPARAISLDRFGRGLTLVDGEDVAGGEKELRAVCADAATLLMLFCDVELGMLDVVRRQDADAERRAASALAGARAHRYLYLEGRALRLVGYRLLFKSDYPGSSVSYRAAFDVTQRARYWRQVANLTYQLAELYELLGLPIDGWRWRYQALEAAARSGSTSALYRTRLSTAWFLARQGLYEAGRLFIPAQDDPRFATIPALERVPALLEHSKAALASGDIMSARETVATAAALVARSADFRAERLKPAILTAQAAVYDAEGRLADAQDAISDAINSMGPERGTYKVSALLERGRLRTEVLKDLEGADQDVRNAIALLRTWSVSPQPVQLEDARVGFEAIAALVSAQPTLRSTSGLFLAEQFREILDGVPEAGRLTSQEALVRALRLDDNTAAFFFLFSDDSLLTWAVRGDDIRFVERPIAPREVTRLAALLDVQIARGAPSQEIWRATLADLYDLLLRDLPGVDGASRIVIVPDGPLNRVPFGALLNRATGKFVFEDVALRTAPNLAFALGDGSAPASATAALSVLAIGEPALPDAAASGFRPLVRARHEARSVAELYKNRSVLIAEHATKAAVLEELPKANVMHFAGHAVAGSAGSPPRLLLAGPLTDPRNALTSADLSGRIGRARIVLAACETATDEANRAAGVTSLAGGFLRSGAAAVVGTLWKVDDAASEQFFLNVHRALVNGAPASMAVARAQRSCYATSACRAAAATWIGTAAYGLE